LSKLPAATGGDNARMTNDNTESTLPVDDGEMHVCQEGPRDAPALLLIHGTASSLRSWDLTAPLLTESHRVIRIDLLGCGRSAKPDGASYAVADQAHRVAAALDQLGVERAVVVGHSSGGMVATALAEQRPELVTAIALVNTGPGMAAFVAEEIVSGPVHWTDLTDEALRRLLSPAFGADFEIPQPFVDEFRHIDLQVYAATSQAASAYLEKQTLPERLALLGKPLLVIFGAADRRWRPASAADYHTVPGATVEMLPGIGHTPILEDPRRTAAAVLAFAADHG
jgi:pimeloyl-ACP methyl ester carboxylesterase